jgi:hypothetical protein
MMQNLMKKSIRKDKQKKLIKKPYIIWIYGFLFLPLSRQYRRVECQKHLREWTPSCNIK